MNSRMDIKPKSGGWGIARTLARQFACVAVLTVVFSSPGYSYAWYSGTSVGSNGIVYGWGYTDASAYMYIHTAKVTTTLRSPNGRTASSGQLSAFNTVSSNVYLTWDSTDLGNYFTASDHSFVCTYMGPVPLGNSNASDTAYNFTVTLAPTVVQPDGIGGSATTTVTVQTTPAVIRYVTLQDVRLPNTGGHPANHPLPNAAVTGTFLSPGATGNTDSAGRLQRNYKATIFSGRHDIKATMSVGTVAATLDVKVAGLGQLTAGDYYYNNNSGPGKIAHPDNWWGTTATRNGLVAAANACPGDPQCNLAQLPYNDISLPWGGKFDGNSYNWAGGHAEHRVGTSADVNSCNFTTLVQARIEFLILFTGGAVSSLDECSTPYHTFHFRW